MKSRIFMLISLVFLSACNLPSPHTPIPTGLNPSATPIPPFATPIPPTNTLVAPTFTPIPDTPVPQITPDDQATYLILQSNSFLLGGVKDGAWLSPEQASVGVSGSTTFRFYELQTLKASARGQTPTKRDAPPCLGAYTADLDTRFNAFHWIGVEAPWEIAPRPVETVDLLTAEQFTLLDNLLAQNGVARLDYMHINAYRADLNGDETQEIILTATALQEESLHMVFPGEYSMAIILHTDSSTLLIGDFYAVEEMAFPSAYAISAILDLNGDGKMEVVVHDRHWEGNLLLVYEINADTAWRVLDTCCMEEAMGDDRCLNGKP